MQKMALDNPYLDLYLETRRDNWDNAYRVRTNACKTFSWAIPNDEALAAIAAHSPIVEIGAGSGYWASCLEDRGALVHAYDIEPAPNKWADISYYPVLQGGPERAAQHPDCALFLCWPPYDEPMAAEALAAYTGDTVIYVGEDYGCTADATFHEQLRNTWEKTRAVTIPQWDGIHDYLMIWERIQV